MFKIERRFVNLNIEILKNHHQNLIIYKDYIAYYISKDMILMNSKVNYYLLFN